MRAIFLGLLCLPIVAADYAVGVGTGPIVRLNAGWEFWKPRAMALGVEIPVGFLGWSQMFHYDLGRHLGSYSERMTAVATPGLRLRLGPEWRVSPWIAAGAGAARIRRRGLDGFFGVVTEQNDTSLVFATDPGLGIDVKVKGNWFLRAEARGSFYQTPTNGFVGAFPFWGQWNVFPAVALSMGWRR